MDSIDPEGSLRRIPSIGPCQDLMGFKYVYACRCEVDVDTMDSCHSMYGSSTIKGAKR
jgi:hypothetical protein